jgi:hypothetical protein
MNSTPPKIRSMRELTHRSNDGIDVTLFWHSDTDELTVCVCDQRRGAYFEIEPEANTGTTEAGIGHNLPQEAPEAFVDAILEVRDLN